MKETINQIQIVTAVAIASTMISGSTVAQSHVPLSVTASIPSSSELAKQSLAKVNGQSYSFAMVLPRRSESSFSKLSFSLTNLDRGNTVVPLPLNLQNTLAQVGAVNAPKKAVTVKHAFIDETGTLWVEFNSPLPPKTPLTVVFKARKPLISGRYAYSIAAYPDGIFSRPTFVSDGTFVSR